MSTNERPDELDNPTDYDTMRHRTMDARGLVLNLLRSLQERGTERLPVDDEARGILRSWMLAARNGGVIPRATPRPTPEAQSPEPQQEENHAPVSLRELADAERHRFTPHAAEPNEQEEIPFFRPGGQNAEEAWQAMERVLPNWQPIRALQTLRPTVVFGSGNRRADIMMVGDAVNYYDEKARQPFQGEAGGKLDGMLKAMGLMRDDIYLTHLVKFRPAQPRQTINTRPPSEKEMMFSLPVLDFEIRLVQPKVIVALGVIAARGLLQRGNLPLAAYQAEPGQYNGIPVVVTHHPSYLLRTNDLAERRRLWEDMLRVMEMAGLPINDKQRGYFLPKA